MEPREERPLVQRQADFDATAVHRATRHIRPGEWASYGTIAGLSSTAARALGSHVSSCPEPDTFEHRILLDGGVSSPGFKWVAEPWRNGLQTQQQALEEERLPFPGGRADRAAEVTESELRERLVTAEQKGISSAPVDVDLERAEAATFRRQPMSPRELAYRRVEGELVQDFAAWLSDRHSHELRGRRLPTGEGGPSLRVDAFLAGRQLLIEAKAGAGREYIRMALGQLYDYRRYFDQPPALAVLLPTRPTQDMEALLVEHAVTLIHRDGDTFVVSTDILD